ncbi:MAG: chromate transporter [Acidibacillus sp.]|uniref:Chromate transporter n=1 Tax=Sulfoacidibacillus ferrooxidans TaxID=2005001 RepID=A0A9X2ABB1_9BACL|nr:chromate transporter [Sulfoacidibacillus ferrooxidans]MCI0182529.1 hypothetical protein [Sulfoacidibacillus ferrooxidans]MCY0894199.1 chromate transporter [Acidibacillus sp.]
MGKTIWNLFFAMLKSGLLGYGGGPASIPIIQSQVVEGYHFMTQQQFTDALALANTLPGPIATKLATFIGYQTGGLLGGFVALVGMVGPTSIGIVLLVNLLGLLKGNPHLAGLIAGVRPVVVVLLLQTAWMSSKGSFPDWRMFAVAVLAALALFVFRFSAPLVILTAMIVGAFVLVPAK